MKKKIEMPTFRNYGQYSSDNYGAHSMEITVGDLHLYFSYRTLVAFRYKGDLTIRQNDWKGTTGKHLNWINRDHKIRIPSDEFEAKWKALSSKLF